MAKTTNTAPPPTSTAPQATPAIVPRVTLITTEGGTTIINPQPATPADTEEKE